MLDARFGVGQSHVGLEVGQRVLPNHPVRADDRSDTVLGSAMRTLRPPAGSV